MILLTMMLMSPIDDPSGDSNLHARHFFSFTLLHDRTLWWWLWCYDDDDFWALWWSLWSSPLMMEFYQFSDPFFHTAFISKKLYVICFFQFHNHFIEYPRSHLGVGAGWENHQRDSASPWSQSTRAGFSCEIVLQHCLCIFQQSFLWTLYSSASNLRPT